METPTADQMNVVAQVAAEFWHVPVEQVFDQIETIKVVKFTGGKVAGFLPSHGKSPSVFFKIYFYDRGFRFENAGLQAAKGMPQVEGVRTPTVIAIMPEYKAFLMERRTWEDTSSPWKRLWINRLGIDWFRVGAWLRAFHDTQTTYEKNDYFLRKKFEKFESHLNDLKHLFTADQVDKMNQIYDSAREYFNENSCEWVISHGDFGLDNIKKSGSMLEIIDFEDCQLAPREFDVLNCIIRMDYANWFLATRHSFDLITNQFLLGYRQNMEKTELSNFLSLLIKLDMLETYDRRKKNKSSNVLIRFTYKLFADNCLKALTRYTSFM
ncbi:MAG: phosphotransferase [Anaerolineaceae bacterium]|nr:phosphotransferase [Anaerolineaceae bacterium]